MNDPNLEKSDELFLILKELKNKGKLDGIIFAFRDGGLIKQNLEDQFDTQKFVSMSASVLESAVGIGDTIGNLEVKRIIAELVEKTMLIFECDNKTFLILIINRKSDISYIFNNLEVTIKKIIRLY
jgi:predicted regulator of Ras-like GTPase activity (Roadblock/LC7/MglB family)